MASSTIAASIQGEEETTCKQQADQDHFFHHRHKEGTQPLSLRAPAAITDGCGGDFNRAQYAGVHRQQTQQPEPINSYCDQEHRQKSLQLHLLLKNPSSLIRVDIDNRSNDGIHNNNEDVGAKLFSKVKNILDAMPLLASTMTSSSPQQGCCLPLHLACHYQPSSPDLIKYVALTHIDALTVRDDQHGRIPLHYLLDGSHRSSSRRVNNLSTASYYLSSTEDLASTATALSSSSSSHADLVRFLVGYFPTDRWSFANYFDSNGESLLHTICRLNIPMSLLSLELVQIIHSLAPSNIKKRLKSQKNRLPLHLAAAVASAAATSAATYSDIHKHTKLINDIIHFLLDSYPNAASIKDDDKNTVLHLLLVEALPSNIEIVRRVINMCPSSLHTPNGSGNFPVHTLCGAEASNTRATTVMMRRGDAGKQSRRQFFSNKRIPLQHLQLLASELPYSIDRAYGPGHSLPIHLVIRHAHDDDLMEALRFLISFNPQTLILSQSHDGGLPIHEACLRNHLEAVTLIADSCPECLDIRHPQLMLPIHCAAQYEDAHVFFFLMDRRYQKFFQNGCCGSNSIGDPRPCDRKLYLHAVLQDENMPAKEIIVKALMKGVLSRSSRKRKRGSDETATLPLSTLGNDQHINEDEARCERWVDENGALPLHIAASTRAPADIIEHLVRAFPESVKVKDKFGRLPLHCYMFHEYPTFDLQSNWPESKSVRDEMGCLPIHYACSSGVSWTMIQRLCMPPTAIFAESANRRGEFPLHKACERGHLDLINNILQLQASDNFVGKPNIQGMSPFLLLAQSDGKGGKFICSGEIEDKIELQHLETLWKLLKRNPKVISIGFANRIAVE